MKTKLNTKPVPDAIPYIFVFCIGWIWGVLISHLSRGSEPAAESEVIEVHSVDIPWYEVHDQNTVQEDEHGCYVTGCRVR